MDENASAAADRKCASVIELARRLVRLPSRGGLDDYGPVLAAVESWLAGRALPHRRLHDPDGALVGIVVEVPGARPGRWWTLDACLDTAPFGDEGAWSFPPTSGEVVGPWLLGRGAADSKLAAAMFCHIAADVRDEAGDTHGGLAVLLDVDEHTGAFGGARAYLADPRAPRPAGVMIGYPGPDELVVGGRGLWRARLHVHGTAGHSGSRATVLGAISRAAHLVGLLDGAELPLPGPASLFPLPPKLTVTAVHGGDGFSVTPDLCVIHVDVRLTPDFDAHDAEALVRRAVDDLDEALPGPRGTDVQPVAAWPPFQLRPDEEPAAALLAAARAVGLAPRPKTAGPSNIGNLLAGEGIPATAGFGVRHEGLHGTDERADLTDLPLVYAAYHGAVRSLLAAP
ncbi:M20/M25/M40 family metallo-hydrolase [Streptomyces sp. NPDC005813]|uniref:M20 family metallopeptidase n=1 Tax=Streptomyces sp. NPDC005813 TaxID=3155592 RepID=UPI0033D562BF